MSRDAYPNLRPGISDVGKALVLITPSGTDFGVASLVYASAGGTITYIPLQNADGETVSETVVQGWVSPVLVRRVTAAAATVYQVLTR